MGSSSLAPAAAADARRRTGGRARTRCPRARRAPGSARPHGSGSPERESQGSARRPVQARSGALGGATGARPRQHLEMPPQRAGNPQHADVSVANSLASSRSPSLTQWLRRFGTATLCSRPPVLSPARASYGDRSWGQVEGLSGALGGLRGGGAARNERAAVAGKTCNRRCSCVLLPQREPPWRAAFIRASARPLYIGRDAAIAGPQLGVAATHCLVRIRRGCNDGRPIPIQTLRAPVQPATPAFRGVV
jgi:hypothetical protein